jgi:hypothetical protein
MNLSRAYPLSASVMPAQGATPHLSLSGETSLPQHSTMLFLNPIGERLLESCPKGLSAQLALYYSLPLTSRASLCKVTPLLSPDAPRQPAALQLLRHIRRRILQLQPCFLYPKASLFLSLPASRAAPSWLPLISPLVPLLQAPWAVPAAVAIPLTPLRAVAATPAVRS